MLQLNADPTFHYESLRVLATARSFGADIGEILNTVEKIVPGDIESWYREYKSLADHVAATPISKTHPVSGRNAMFRASNYYRSADFFLHGNANDPRLVELWDKQTKCFDLALSLMDIPGRRFVVKATDFDIPGIFYRAANDGKPRPTLLLLSGYDGSQEELLHAFGFNALERGFNVVTFEGPGQPKVMRDQNVGFITEYERVITPIVDYCAAIPEIDSSKLALLGYSLGGFLVARAAAFEHRLAAVICVDGVFDVYKSFASTLPEPLQQMLRAGDFDGVNKAIGVGMKHNTGLRWSIEQGCWSFKVQSPTELLEKARPMSMEKIANQIECPVLVCEGEDDKFFAGQPQMLVDSLGGKATYVKLTEADAAGSHCHVGATDLINAVVMDWVQDLLK
jgi:pimeloyl-ACP methyl ester carboxylesterase